MGIAEETVLRVSTPLLLAQRCRSKFSPERPPLANRTRDFWGAILNHDNTLASAMVWRQIETVRRGFKTHQGRLNQLKLCRITHCLKLPL
ncbi:MAG: hypothetical protein A2157_19190 [Deltaproteobacteria bacterium RBG_16_47_11]|nr:MAG: hypothetical protein A2157_19190 [Deltaproteobacteria bacterium RBG_16_47_11]